MCDILFGTEGVPSIAEKNLKIEGHIIDFQIFSWKFKHYRS
jgi:hypothetical protein